MLVDVPKKCDEFLQVRKIYYPIEGFVSFDLSVLAGSRIWISQEAIANLLLAEKGQPGQPKKSIVAILVPFLVPKLPQHGPQNRHFSKTADPYETCTGIDGSHIRRLPKAPKIETKCELESGY